MRGKDILISIIIISTQYAVKTDLNYRDGIPILSLRKMCCGAVRYTSFSYIYDITVTFNRIDHLITNPVSNK